MSFAGQDPKLNWEAIDRVENIARAKVFGGWLIKQLDDVMTVMHAETHGQVGYEWRQSICFIPDPHHEWVLE
jgi:hypothetical protein